MSNDDLINIQVTVLVESHLKQFWNIKDDSDLNAESSSQVHTAFDRNKACYRLLYQEKKKNASVQLFLEHFCRESW